MGLPLASLPAVNAALNAASACLLFTGWLFIRRGNVLAHRACMVSAFLCSTVFLASYLYYHARVGHVRFSGAEGARIVYLSILGSHTCLAIAVVPMALRTLYLAAKERFEEHRRIARWTLPIWLYVSVTGVIVYAMLYRL